MGKHTRNHGKNRSIPYESGASSDNAQTNETSADKESEANKCEHCDNQADQLLPCESCNLWFCCACQSVPAGMMIALTSYKCLHWFCKTCEPGVASKLSNSSATSKITPDLSDHIDKKIDESVTKALQQLSKIVSQSTETIKSTLDSLQRSPPTDPAAHLNETSANQSTSRNFTPVNHSRQYNAVFYGLSECNMGTHHLERVKLDLDKVAEVCASIDCNIPKNAIRDCIRLGKYVPNSSRPKPILVKFNSTIHVASLFSRKGSCPSGISIKHDLSPTERQIESTLLKERWQLLQSGVDRKSIKIKGPNIFVAGKLHARVTNGALLKENPSPTDQSTSAAQTQSNLDSNSCPEAMSSQ